MRIVKTKVYQYQELSDEAKEKARDWYREGSQHDEWWDFQNVRDAAKYLGIEIDDETQKRVGGYVFDKGTKVTTWDSNKETTYTKPCIYFSGFWSQGDGASFLGTWRADKMRPPKELKADFASDKELWRIHQALWEFATKYPESYCTSSRSNSHYSHERSTNLEAVLDEEIDYNKETHKPLEECLVDFMQWIYRALEREYEYINSDEQVTETIMINEYEFTEEGKRA